MDELDQLCINTIRMLSVDTVQKAESGHPGMPMGAATIAYVLWTRHLRHNPKNPAWPDRDRFVLSAGHASALLYSLLHLTGYDLSLDDLKQFRQWGSRTPGHPERGCAPGRRGDHRPARAGAGQRRRPGHRGTVAGGDLQSAGARDRGPPHLCAGERRRHDGGAVQRSGVAGRDAAAWPVDRRSTTPTASRSRRRRTSRSSRTSAGVSRRAAGMCSTSTATTWPRSTRRSSPRARSRTVRRSSSPAPTSATAAPRSRTPSRRTASPSAPTRCVRPSAPLGWPEDPPFHLPGGRAARLSIVGRTRRRARGRLAGEAWTPIRRVSLPSAADFTRGLAGELPHGWQAHLPVFTPADGEMATRDAGGKVLAALAGGGHEPDRRVGRSRSVHAHRDEGPRRLSRARLRRARR